MCNRGRKWRAARSASIGAMILMAGVTLAAGGGDEPDQKRALARMSIEELMDMEFTSASKQAEKLSDAKAAAFVITGEDLRRAGVRNIPEALRMVPGVHVGRVGSSRWAITSRGFNGVFANKLLVLMDGRSVYDPLYSGVFWDVQDVVIQDIDRIEVIRGPGASLWGANAVNGVINIITKNAVDTTGTLVDLSAGDETLADVAVRHGGGSDDLAYRVYARYTDRDEAVDAAGVGTGDDWNLLRAGFRADWRANNRDAVMWSGDLHTGELQDRVRIPLFEPPYELVIEQEAPISGGHLMGRWSRDLANDSALELQVYYARNKREIFDTTFEHDTFDIDFQHRFHAGERHELLWGVAGRSIKDEIRNSRSVQIDPLKDSYGFFSLFLQDNFRVSDRVGFTLGAKAEYHDFSDWEIQPSLRAFWKPGDRHTFWAAVSGAARTPFRGQLHATINLFPIPPSELNPLPGVGRLIAVQDIPSENLVAYEAGYRVLANESLSLDFAAFFNQYDDLHLFVNGEPLVEMDPPPPHLVIPIQWTPIGSGHTYGIEFDAGWQVSRPWRLQFAMSVLQVEIEASDPAVLLEFMGVNGSDPSWQASLRSRWDVTESMELDLWVRYVDDLPADGIDSYTELDVRAGWQVSRRVELVLGGRNLLDDQHAEFETEDFTVGEIERNFYGRAVFRY